MGSNRPCITAESIESIHLLRESAEDISLLGASIDTIVLTWALCSIPDARRALGEMRRVLKPGGRLRNRRVAEFLSAGAARPDLHIRGARGVN
jgi:ubiquinone/menaquinone biosynthesis C-methylase UbiE